MEKNEVTVTDKTGEQSITFDKIIYLQNRTLNESLNIGLKLTENKVSAAKLMGEICSCSKVESTLEKNSWEKIPAIIDSTSVVYPFHYQAAIILAFESLVNPSISISSRATYLRTIVLELERIQSNFHKLGFIAKGISYPIFEQKVMVFRSEVLKQINVIAQLDTGKPFITFGGVSRDITEEEIVSLYQMLARIERKINAMKIRNQRNPLINGLFKDVGFISRETAKKLSLVGPIARASGITVDVRQTSPYFAYNEVTFNTPVSDYCDLFGEFLLLFDDIILSIEIIRELLQSLSDESPIPTKSSYDLKAGTTVVRIETPTGELFSFASSKKGTQTAIPRLFKFTCPMTSNMQGHLSRITGEGIDNLSTIALFIGEGWGVKL